MKLIIHLLYDQEIPSLGIYQTEMKINVHRKTCMQIFWWLYLILSQAGKHPNTLQLVNGFKKLLHLYNEQLPSNKKNPTTGIHNNIDEC